MKNIITYLPSVTKLAVPVACCAFFAAADQEFGADQDNLVDEMYEEEVTATPETTTSTEVVAEPDDSQVVTKKPVKRPVPQGTANRTIATVNGRAVTSRELRMRFVPYMGELTALHPNMNSKAFKDALIAGKKKLTDELIERELVVIEFENQGFVLPEEEVDKEIENRILTTFAGDRKKFNEYLKKSGQTYNSYRKDLRKELIVGMMRSNRYEFNVPPTPDQIRQEYNRTKSDYREASNDQIEFNKIFIKMQNLDADPQISARKNFAEAARLVRAIEQGQLTFADAAKAYSADAFAEQGGKNPITKRNGLSPDFASIIFGAKPGKIVGPIFTPEGCIIAQVIRLIEAPAPSLDAPGIRAKVEESVKRRESADNYNKWIKRLKNKAIIRYIQ